MSGQSAFSTHKKKTKYHFIVAPRKNFFMTILKNNLTITRILNNITCPMVRRLRNIYRYERGNAKIN